jgi:hypothetical protein
VSVLRSLLRGGTSILVVGSRHLEMRFEFGVKVGAVAIAEETQFGLLKKSYS